MRDYDAYVAAIEAYARSGPVAERGTRHIAEASRTGRATAESDCAAALARMDRLDRDLNHRCDEAEALLSASHVAAAVRDRAAPHRVAAARDVDEVEFSESFARHRSALADLEAAAKAYAEAPPPLQWRADRRGIVFAAVLITVFLVLFGLAALVGWL